VDVLDEPDVLDVQAEELAAGVPVVGLDARVVAVGPVDGTSVVWQKAQPTKQVCKAIISTSYFSLFGWNCVVYPFLIRNLSGVGPKIKLRSS
jgi:hypothetical protein